MLFRIVIPLYVVLVTAASIILHKTSSPLLLIIFASVFTFIHHYQKKWNHLKFLQIIFLGLFHWFSHTNWILPIYLLIVGRDYYRVKRSPFIFLVYVTLYVSVRLSYSPNTIEQIAMICFDLINFLVAIAISKNIHESELQAQILIDEKKHLSTHDTLTGLINYEEYHKLLEKLIKSEKALVIILIDCTDLKSMNNAQGFSGGNRILKEIADLLRIVFSNVHMIARYGGDEFALALKSGDEKQTISNIERHLGSEIPRLTGIQLTYGYATYPEDGITKDDLILVAEKMLFSMKREIWLKREDHLFRSEKLKVVGELASGMAHEIRNPLTTVKGFVQISRSNGYNIEPWYHLIMDEITRMSELTGEFLQFSKPHVSQFRIQPLHECVQRVIYLMESESTRLGHKIIYVPWNQPLPVLVDQDKMVQLLLNLVKNCFEAMENEGKVFITLSEYDNHGVLEVQDTGKGIPEKNLDKIFLPFFTTKESGTGLGLAICHKIVQDHKGIIELESTLSEGTTFRITLPLAYNA